MKSGKIFLMIFIVLSSAIGLALIQDFASDKKQSVSVDDFFSQTRTKTIKLSDGVGTNSNG
jgi:hypothetical protein